MPATTRGKGNETESLVEKVKALSPGSHGRVSTGLSSPPGKSGTCPTCTGEGQGQVNLDQVYQLILEVKDSFDQHKQSVESQIKKLTDDLHAHLDTVLEQTTRSIKKQITDSADEVQAYVDGEVGRITSQIDDVVKRVTSLEETQTPDYDPEVSVIMSRVPQSEGEDIQQVAEKIIHEGLHMPEVPVIRAMRLGQREARPGQRQVTPLVKVQLRNLDDKKKVLRAKLNLANSTDFGNVWIRSSKPHIERLIDLNFKTILEMIPGGNTMTITNSGRIVKKNTNNT